MCANLLDYTENHPILRRILFREVGGCDAPKSMMDTPPVVDSAVSILDPGSESVPAREPAFVAAHADQDRVLVTAGTGAGS